MLETCRDGQFELYPRINVGIAVAANDALVVSMVKDGHFVPGKLMELTLSCDHRILDGAEGAEFLAEIKRILQEPLALSL